jgi:RNA polymerase sigma-70 factor (ECF subfamily)
MPDASDRTNVREAADEALMQRYADGDATAFEELFRRYESRSFAYFARRTHSVERARDLYQELFLRVHRARDRYDPGRAFAPWFFQIAHRLLIDDQRRAYRAREVVGGERTPDAPAPTAGDAVSDREQLARLLDVLSTEERHVLVCAKGEGIGYAELAAELGKSVDAVKKMASRAVQRLRAASAADPTYVAPRPS